MNKQEIIEKRKELKEEFEELLREETDDMMKVVAIFDDGNPMELENILELATDAWNYFPHKILGGKAPVDKL